MIAFFRMAATAGDAEQLAGGMASGQESRRFHMLIRMDIKSVG